MRIFLLLILAMPLCAQSVKTDYDTQTDFKKFKTYAWLAPGDSVLNRERLDKVYGGTITYAANQELKSRGLKIDTLQPDAIFVFYTSTDEIIQYSQSPTLSIGVGVAGPGYYVGGSAPVAGGKITETSMEDGSLKYSMYDTQTKKLVWSGSVEKTFNRADDIPKMLSDYTTRIFKKSPIKKKK
ncbi:MAG: DUF4136 domain-containing protein [Cyclobacteriaceae bacterium]|jgi:hypothetical protein|nr:DUF4136 domain-containing protein [Cyclobacteriaceae bacterium]